MEPDVVSNQPKINRNTFKIGSGDLQQQVANNTKRIRVISTMLRSNRRRSADGLSPQATNIQQSLEQSNLILADIAIQLESDFQDRENREKRLLLRSREEKLELRRRNIEQDLEYKKTEKKITKSSNKIKGPIQGIFKTLGKILLLFGGLVLIGALLKPGAISNIIESKEFQNAKVALETTFEVLTKNMKAILIVAGAIVGLKLAASLVAIVKVGAGILAILANPLLIAGIGILYAAAKQGLGKDEKDVIKELEQMGGFSKENRDKLIAKKQAELDAETSKNILLQRPGLIAALKKDIKFLQTGGMGSPDFDGEYRQKIDFEKIESGASYEESILKKGRDFHRGGYNPSGVGRVHAGEFVLQKSAVDKIGLEKLYAMNSGNPVTFTFDDLPPIDMRTKKTIDQKNNISATQVIRVSSTNNNNALMNEVPILFGFDNLVYT